MKLLIINLFIIATITGCQATSCPSFPDVLNDYFPYSKGEVISFVNRDNDTLKIIISDQWTTQPYTIKWNCKCVCEAIMGFKTDFMVDQLLKIEGEILIYPEENKSELRMEFFNSQINSDYFAINVENKNPYSDNYTNLFGDTIQVTKADTYRIETIKIVYGKGLIEFYDKKENCNWVKIDQDISSIYHRQGTQIH